jgi:hypothetical protein
VRAILRGARPSIPQKCHSRKQGSEHRQYLGVRWQKRTNHRRPKHQRKHDPHKESVGVHGTPRFRPRQAPKTRPSVSSLTPRFGGAFSFGNLVRLSSNLNR